MQQPQPAGGEYSDRGEQGSLRVEASFQMIGNPYFPLVLSQPDMVHVDHQGQSK
jgi:hypothetical protein